MEETIVKSCEEITELKNLTFINRFVKSREYSFLLDSYVIFGDNRYKNVPLMKPRHRS